jgi:hypothetical protein
MNFLRSGAGGTAAAVSNLGSHSIHGFTVNAARASISGEDRGRHATPVRSMSAAGSNIGYAVAQSKKPGQRIDRAVL